MKNITLSANQNLDFEIRGKNIYLFGSLVNQGRNAVMAFPKFREILRKTEMSFEFPMSPVLDGAIISRDPFDRERRMIEFTQNPIITASSSMRGICLSVTREDLRRLHNAVFTYAGY